MTDQNEYMDETVLIETIENQLEEGKPLKVKATLMRLMMTGTPREEAIEAMACALAVEVFDVMKNGATFNEKRYAEHLDMLPDLGFMEGE
ncbi:hypothetical protein BCU68_01600 [Vibrio sp. 10N.286.49.B3]|uniref:hypothetical protein n=1 Tax=Vibrio sp. 10N.286.49.B3 TaxID=1880855 RepID=UPI000C861174|nr:hypothetical protein [Vibrio sp. 10N.286.49.B3]PMH46756.1 hypothetical protein BCU68_01600 [Vibrio sp. 10N.286.49.B3]